MSKTRLRAAAPFLTLAFVLALGAFVVNFTNPEGRLMNGAHRCLSLAILVAVCTKEEP